jgi:hypothetical protein
MNLASMNLSLAERQQRVRRMLNELSEHEGRDKPTLADKADAAIWEAMLFVGLVRSPAADLYELTAAGVLYRSMR